MPRLRCQTLQALAGYKVPSKELFHLFIALSFIKVDENGMHDIAIASNTKKVTEETEISQKVKESWRFSPVDRHPQTEVRYDGSC